MPNKARSLRPLILRRRPCESHKSLANLCLTHMLTRKSNPETSYMAAPWPGNPSFVGIDYSCLSLQRHALTKAYYLAVLGPSDSCASNTRAS